MKFKAALAQIDCKVGDFEHNLERHLRAIEKAQQKDAKLVVFPELSLTGYSLRDLAWDLALDPFRDKRLDPLREKSREISLAFGFVESAQNHGIYNSALFLENGIIRHIHRKVYPPTYGMFEEGRYFSRGDQACAFDSKLGRFGILICEDMWHLSLPYILAYDGAEVILSLTASPSRMSPGSQEMASAQVNHEHHRTYARLLSSYVLFCNRVGYEDGVNFWGGSCIVTPSGAVAESARFFKEDVIVTEIESLEIQRARRFSRHFLDEDLTITHRALARLRSTKGLPTSEESSS
jgi:NAD+ synthase (glutamine-hydrolysing)